MPHIYHTMSYFDPDSYISHRYLVGAGNDGETADKGYHITYTTASDILR